MVRHFLSVSLFSIIFGFGASAHADDTIRVACIGDSITFGSGISNREKNSYPAQLGVMLGKEYDVRNFGVSGATLLNQGDLPYTKQNAYKAALKFEPNIVIIKLGTNDSKPQNWKKKDQYVADYVSLIESFQQLPSMPKVYLCYPVPVFEDHWGITENVVKAEVVPLVKEVSEKTKLPVIDLYAALSDQAKCFPDGVHPNADGAKLMAEAVSKALAKK